MPGLDASSTGSRRPTTASAFSTGSAGRPARAADRFVGGSCSGRGVPEVVRIDPIHGGFRASSGSSQLTGCGPSAPAVALGRTGGGGHRGYGRASKSICGNMMICWPAAEQAGWYVGRPEAGESTN